jgi:hypothetical protein
MVTKHRTREDSRLATLRRMLVDAKREVEELGGLATFKTGEWVLALVQKSFESYFANANGDYFREKYGTSDNDFVAGKLIAVAAEMQLLSEH